MQRTQGAIGEMLVEIGHDTDHVRKIGAGVERRAALVVDQHEREVIRARSDGQSGDERAQQLALAGAGRARQQGVGAVAHEIDVDHPVAGDTDHRTKWRIDASCHPRGGDCRRVGGRQQREHGDVSRDSTRSAQRILRIDQSAERFVNATALRSLTPEPPGVDRQTCRGRIGVPPGEESVR